MAMAVWKQKQITIETAISDTAGLKTLLLGNIPNGSMNAILVRDELTSYENRTLIYCSYLNGECKTWTRYNSSNNTYTTGSEWGVGYGSVLEQGSTYTLFYQ